MIFKQKQKDRWHDMSLNDLMQIMGQSQLGSSEYGYAIAEFNRRQFKSANKSMIVSIIATVAAMLSALGAFLTISAAQNENKIAASIDVAWKHLTDAPIAEGRTLAIKMLSSGSPTSLLPDQQKADSFSQFILGAEYLANLLDKKRIDRAYLTDAVTCDLWIASAALTKLPGKPEPASLIMKTGKVLEGECKKTVPNYTSPP